MAELADALASGASEGDLVEVRVFLAAYLFFLRRKKDIDGVSLLISFFIKRRYTWSDEKENNILSKRI